MILKMCGLRERIPVEKMRQEMGVMAINNVIKLGRLRWFGHVKRREDYWVRRCMDMEIESRNPKGRPKRTWRQVVREDLRLMGVEEAEDRDCWRFRLDCMRFMAMVEAVVELPQVCTLAACGVCQ